LFVEVRGRTGNSFDPVADPAAASAASKSSAISEAATTT
jgi:hypothetical protein